MFLCEIFLDFYMVRLWHLRFICLCKIKPLISFNLKMCEARKTPRRPICLLGFKSQMLPLWYISSCPNSIKPEPPQQTQRVQNKQHLLNNFFYSINHFNFLEIIKFGRCFWHLTPRLLKRPWEDETIISLKKVQLLRVNYWRWHATSDWHRIISFSINNSPRRDVIIFAVAAFSSRLWWGDIWWMVLCVKSESVPRCW